jgi:hypothetical protein
MSEPVYRSLAESLKRAALSYRESPLKVPLDKYERWKEITFIARPGDAV